jgi:hypothetical protein
MSDGSNFSSELDMNIYEKVADGKRAVIEENSTDCHVIDLEWAKSVLIGAGSR